MHTDAQRHQLYDELSDLLSDSSRDVLMELLPPNGWADVARQSDIALLRDDMTVLRSELRGEMAELRGEMGELRGEMTVLRSELRGEMAELRGEMSEVRGEMAEFRGELKELRGSMTSMLPKLMTANIASMIGVAGLVLAATQFT